MVELIHAPEPHNLVPPLLACLPTAFASARPPPALLSLVSPVLRQRLQLISSTSRSSDNWLRLLCWDSAEADRLKEIVEEANFEPHPSSGEIETGDVGQIVYKRFDPETLRAQVPLAEWNLNAVYLWCTGGEGGNGWKLAELLPYKDAAVDASWSMTIGQANETSTERLATEALRVADASERKPSLTGEDDYWAMYDKTPQRTPATNRSPAPQAALAGIFRQRHGSEDYYARYGDVQPAMDNHDPTEETRGLGQSTLDGDLMQDLMRSRSNHVSQTQPPAYEELIIEEEDARDFDDDAVIVSQPQPTSPSSGHSSDAVSRLEQTAERQAASEVGIRQHISTSIKSMFRLAKSAGMDREEFERMVQREVETLSILDSED